jgi:hypothetical protein
MRGCWQDETLPKALRTGSPGAFRSSARKRDPFSAGTQLSSDDKLTDLLTILGGSNWACSRRATLARCEALIFDRRVEQTVPHESPLRSLTPPPPPKTLAGRRTTTTMAEGGVLYSRALSLSRTPALSFPPVSTCMLTSTSPSLQGGGRLLRARRMPIPSGGAPPPHPSSHHLQRQAASFSATSSA